MTRLGGGRSRSQASSVPNGIEGWWASLRSTPPYKTSTPQRMKTMQIDAVVRDSERDSIAPRRLTLLDAMILVVASAVGLAWYRAASHQFGNYCSRAGVPSPIFALYRRSLIGFETAFPFLAALTMAQPVLRLLRPRPSWRHLRKEPGWIACLSATVVFALAWAHIAMTWAVWMAVVAPGLGNIGNHDFIGSAFNLTSSCFLPGSCVIVAWLVLWSGRRWRGFSDWVDRLGRLLGFTWLAVIPIRMTFGVLWALSLYGFF